MMSAATRLATISLATICLAATAVTPNKLRVGAGLRAPLYPAYPRLAALLLICGLLTGLASSIASAHPYRDLYGDEIRFRVLRNEKPVGEYVTRFETTATGWSAHVDMQLSLQWLNLFHYRYHYQGTEDWQDGRLRQLSVSIDDNGERQQLQFRRDQQQLVSANGATRIALPILTSHHFNADVIHADRILNTLTGKENRIALLPLGEETLQIGARAVAARHYRYTGELHDTDIWYGPAGQWLQLTFKDKRGSLIRFECIDCGV